MNQTTSENGALLKPIALTEWNIIRIDMGAAADATDYGQ